MVRRILLTAAIVIAVLYVAVCVGLWVYNAQTGWNPY